MAGTTDSTPIKAGQQRAGEGAKIGNVNIGDEIGIGRINPEPKRGDPRITQESALESGVHGGGTDHLLERGVKCGRWGHFSSYSIDKYAT
ncbi:MAG: hypothetical protein ACRDG4_08990, partial [Chloroflexota bacterium]